MLPYVALAGRTTAFCVLRVSRNKVPVLFVVRVQHLLDDRRLQIVKMRLRCIGVYSRDDADSHGEGRWYQRNGPLPRYPVTGGAPGG